MPGGERRSQRRRSEHRRCTHAGTPRQRQRFSDREARAPHDHGGVGPTCWAAGLAAASDQRSGGDAPEARGAGAQRSGALHVRRRQPNGHWAGGATRRVPEGGPRRGPWHAPCGAPVPFLAPRAGAVRGRLRPTAPAGAVRAPLRVGSSWTRTTRSRGARGAGARRGRRRRGRARKGAAFGSGRRGGRAAALHGSRRRGPPPLAVTPRESPARRVPAAEGGLRATPHRGRSQAKRAWPDAYQLCPSRLRREGAPAPPSGAASGPVAEQVAATPKAS